jgi:hypothetical protein
MALLVALDIINAACARIGADPLETLDEETDGGQAASFIYEDVVDFNIGLNPFYFAMEYRQLSRIDGARPFSGYDFVFDVPGERLGPPLYLSDDVTDPDRRFTEYVLSNGQVHASVEPLFAKVKFRPDPHLWIATFKTCTITACASRLALALASDRALYGELDTEAYGTPTENRRGGQMRTAITEDAQAQPPRRRDVRNNPLELAWRS